MSTSKLQIQFGNMLDKRLPEFKIKENVRPDWLISSDNTWLELDFYIEEIKTAFEVQGEQHYKFVPFFHKTEEDFRKRQKHDQEKRDLCYGKGIKLIHIITTTDAEIAIENIKEKYCIQPKYLYQDDEACYPPSKKNEKWHEIEDRKAAGLTRKMIKRNNINSNERCKRRLAACVKVLDLFEKGKIEAAPDKVNYWKQVIENDGLFTE